MPLLHSSGKQRGFIRNPCDHRITHLFVQEFQISCALILDILCLISLILPITTCSFPILFLFIFVLVAEIESILFRRLFAVCSFC